jgi:hypothetical protein
MVVTVMGPAHRDSEFMADLASHCAGLGEPRLWASAGLLPQIQTRLGCDKLEVPLVAVPPRLADGEFARLDFGGSGGGLELRRSRRDFVDGRLRRDWGGRRVLGTAVIFLGGPPSPPRFWGLR